MKKLLFVVTLAIFSTTSLFAGEVLQNGGFESGTLGPWYNAVNSCNVGTCINWAVETNTVFAGQDAAGNTGDIELRQDFAPVLGSQITNISFWFDASIYEGEAIYLYYSDGTHGFVGQIEQGNQWTYNNVTGAVDPTKFLTGIGLWGGSPDVVTYVDNISITTGAPPIPEPGALTMFGSGLLAMAGAVRRKLF